MSAVLRSALTAKERATLIARAALLEVALVITEGDDGRPLFVASRWALVKSMRSVAEVEQLLRAMGGPTA